MSYIVVINDWIYWLAVPKVKMISVLEIFRAQTRKTPSKTQFLSSVVRCDNEGTMSLSAFPSCPMSMVGWWMPLWPGSLDEILGTDHFPRETIGVPHLCCLCMSMLVYPGPMWLHGTSWNIMDIMEDLSDIWKPRSTAYAIPAAVGVLDQKRQTTLASAEYFLFLGQNALGAFILVSGCFNKTYMFHYVSLFFWFSAMRLIRFWYFIDHLHSSKKLMDLNMSYPIPSHGSYFIIPMKSPEMSFTMLNPYINCPFFRRSPGFDQIHRKLPSTRSPSSSQRTAPVNGLRWARTLANWWVGTCVKRPLVWWLSWKISSWNWWKCNSTLGWKLGQPAGNRWEIRSFAVQSPNSCCCSWSSRIFPKISVFHWTVKWQSNHRGSIGPLKSLRVPNHRWLAAGSYQIACDGKNGFCWLLGASCRPGTWPLAAAYAHLEVSPCRCRMRSEGPTAVISVTWEVTKNPPVKRCASVARWGELLRNGVVRNVKHVHQGAMPMLSACTHVLPVAVVAPAPILPSVDAGCFLVLLMLCTNLCLTAMFQPWLSSFATCMDLLANFCFLIILFQGAFCVENAKGPSGMIVCSVALSGILLFFLGLSLYTLAETLFVRRRSKRYDMLWPSS